MTKVSVIIPARAEGDVLQKTVADVLAKATGDIEVIVGFDGPPYNALPDDPRVKAMCNKEVIGLKANLNQLAQAATGQWLMKTDAHCMFAPGFDETLAADMQPDWIVTPRFYVLDAARWAWQDDRFYDYFYLSCPFTDPRGFRFKAGGHWGEHTQAWLNMLIDETPQIHGSCWFVARDYYLNTLGGFPTDDPFGHAQEPPYLGLKTWLGGGRVMVNKKTWYAHMHQQGDRRGYTMSNRHVAQSYKLVADYWMGNQWAGRKHDMDWFVQKFWPMPSWPDDWRQRYDQWLLTHSTTS